MGLQNLRGDAVNETRDIAVYSHMVELFVAIHYLDIRREQPKLVPWF